MKADRPERGVRFSDRVRAAGAFAASDETGRRLMKLPCHVEHEQSNYASRSKLLICEPATEGGRLFA